MAKKKRSNQLLKYLGIAVVLLILGAIVAKQMGWAGKKELTKIAVEKAERRTIIETVAASGKIFPEVEVKIAPDVSGEVIEVAIEEGDTVKKGQLLARIDPQIYESLVDRAKAAVDGAKSNTANSDARIIQAEARIDQFEARKQQVETRRKQFESRRKQLEARRTQVKAGGEQFGASEKRIQASKEQYESQKQQLEAQKQQFEAQKEQLESQKQQFEAQKQQLEARKQQFEARKQQLKAREKQIQAQIDNAQKNYDRNKQLFDEDIISQADLDNIELQLKTVKADKESLAAEKASLDSEIVGLDAEIASVDAQKLSLSAEQKNINAQQKNLDAQQSGLNAGQKNLEADQFTLKAEKTRLGGDQLTLSAEEIALDGEIAALEAELLGLEGELTALKADVTAAEKTAEGSTFNVKSAQASLKEAKDNLRRTNIYAPVDGIVSSLNVEAGERVVGTSQFAGTEIINVAGFDEMEVQVDVSENDILRVKLGDTVIVEIDAYLDRDFTGIVSEIANSAQSGAAALATDQITNYKVKIRLLRESYQDLFNQYALPFRPGMSASVEIQTKKVSKVIAVPIQSVTTRELPDSLKKDTGKEEDEIEEVVFVYEEGKVAKKKVKVGIQNESYIQILSGLAANEEVVSAPYRAISKKLKADMEVEKVDKDKLYKKID